MIRALLLVVAGLARTAAADCAIPHQRPEILNDGVAAPPMGGLVVATVVDHRNVPEDGEALQPAWVFQHGATSAKPNAVILAPGLVLYVLPEGMTDATLVDGKAARARVTASAAKVTPLPAPAVRSIILDEKLERRGLRGLVTVDLTAARPADAIAMIISDGKSRAALSYGLVGTDAKSVVVYQHADCDPLPNGTVSPIRAQSVTVRWVDKLGRLSPASKPVTVKASK